MIAKLSPTPLSLANDVKPTPVRPSAIARPRLEIAVPKEKATTTSPLQMTRRNGIPPPPLSTCGVASVDRKAMTTRRNSAAIPSAPRSSNGSNASSCSTSSKASVTPLKRTVSAPRLTSRSSTASQCASVTTTRGPSATPKKISAAPTPRKPLTTPVTPRSTDQRHELVAKRREEKEQREAQARKEALRQREERRLLLEAKMQAEKDARAELVRKRLLERDDHLLKRHV
ncbi:hypothetical protein SDRG_01435 [Saprolegnia diclina VS20]|uniref:Uncharacterized protein n=1 Tax=Saprolegnia diclina (strain VS20) TaxID=1156394 RepID=T0S8A8_SAPDV|nr:hypothetical protein SDRG_01435 [Saprolegnia diclina VS20]EQC41468.1 hypothetical protein SDRG_01435 [Saprolegnia diclina VS20]|eukprot:XP_008605182.1 hypothetical protein SDRG_01435 [Saprolegnia diclina VS20]